MPFIASTKFIVSNRATTAPRRPRQPIMDPTWRTRMCQVGGQLVRRRPHLPQRLPLLRCITW